MTGKKNQGLCGRAIMMLRLGLWCLMPLSTILQIYIVVVSFIGRGNQSARRKTTGLSQVID